MRKKHFFLPKEPVVWVVRIVRVVQVCWQKHLPAFPDRHVVFLLEVFGLKYFTH